MGDFNLNILPNEIQDNIFEFLDYKEQFNDVLRELKMVFKINKMMITNNYVKRIIIHNYIIYEYDD